MKTTANTLFLLMKATIANNRHKTDDQLTAAVLKVALEFAATVARSNISDQADLQASKAAKAKGELYWGGHYLPYDSMCDAIAEDFDKLVEEVDKLA